MNGAYFEYLRKRTSAGLLYRKFWLYPYLKRQLQGSVLDVGCGIGDFVRSFPGAVGVDVNTRAVEWCRLQGLSVYLMEPDVLPLDDKTFDSVVLDNVLEHLLDPTLLLSEIKRVLRPNGVLVVGVPGPNGYLADSDHKVYYDEVNLLATLKASGFLVESVKWQPVRNDWLAERLPQFALYGTFRLSRWA
jgi:SAM-dependent methyltransferase